jgi:hypothetical protein
MPMQQDIVRVTADGSFRFDVREDCAVWVDSRTGTGEWRVCASTDHGRLQMQTADVWEDVFEAIKVAWRVAITVRAITNRDDFVEVCREVHAMAVERSDVVLFPKAVREIMAAGKK